MGGTKRRWYEKPGILMRTTKSREISKQLIAQDTNIKKLFNNSFNLGWVHCQQKKNFVQSPGHKI